jgi:hypothetical protein
MGIPTSEVSYTSATARRGDHKVHMGHVVALGGESTLHTQTSNHNDLNFIIVINVQEECSKMFAILPNHTMSLAKKKERREIQQTNLYVLKQASILQTSIITKAKLENL